MDSFLASYKKVLKGLREVEVREYFGTKIRKPKLSDLEVIALSLTAEYLSIDSEYQLFRKIPQELRGKIERSVYNRRRRRLFPFLEEIRKKLRDKLIARETIYLVDSMPLEVCKKVRGKRSKICKDVDFALPNYGYCASQKMHFYGYKLHLVCSAEGVVHNFDLSPASVHDLHFLKDVKLQLSHCTLIGDKGYVSADYQLDLFQSRQIKLHVPSRVNQKKQVQKSGVIMKVRKRIETLFSQGCDQFMLKRNYAKIFQGFKVRILAKITAITIIQYFNRQEGHKLNKLKVCIA
jgi:hypothetical protein